jgi:hypothetical protein
MHAYQKQYLANLADDKPLDIGEITRAKNKRENAAARLGAMLALRKPTARGLACAAAARKAWLEDEVIAPEAMDSMEVIWWRNHDADGRMICRAPAACSCARCVSLLNK